MDEERVGSAGGASGLTGADIRAVADALEPGTSAAFVVFEHAWSRGLRPTIAEVAASRSVDGFLQPDVLAHLG